MSGIIIENNFYENSDLICKRCNSSVWEIEHMGNLCLVCNSFLNDSDTTPQHHFYFPRVGVAYLNHDSEYVYLKDKQGKIIVFENQMSAECSLIAHKTNPEHFYFVEIDFLNNIKDNKYGR